MRNWLDYSSLILLSLLRSLADDWLPAITWPPKPGVRVVVSAWLTAAWGCSSVDKIMYMYNAYMLTYYGHHIHATWCTCCFLAFDQLNNRALFWAISDCFIELQVVKSRGLNSVDNWHDQFTTRRKLTKELQQASIEKQTKKNSVWPSQWSLVKMRGHKQMSED